MTGELSNDVAVLIKDLLKSKYVGTAPSFRTSPPGDQNYGPPMVVVKNLDELEQVMNVHGTRHRVKSQVWLYASANTKAGVTTIKDALKVVHRANWKSPGSGMKHIIMKGVSNNDHLDWVPQIYERIIKWEVVWDETT
jgi:hypothetical protein